jgi:hypothetical protein
MRRLTVALIGLVLIASSGLLTAFRTITVPQGYQFQVPADWVTLSAAGTPRAFDVAVTSPDHQEFVTGASGPASAAVAADPSQLVEEMLAGSHQFLQQMGSNAATILAGPDTVQVANADQAVELTMRVADAQGSTTVASFRVALQGSKEYGLAVVAPQDTYNTDPDLAAILNSFELTAPSSPASLTPEEAIMAILPYQLAQSDALPGYTVGPPLPPPTAVTLAMREPSPVSSFNAWQQSGLLVGNAQALLPTADTDALPDTRGSFRTWLFQDAASAHAFIMQRPPSVGGTAYETIPLGMNLGDASGAWHAIATSPDRPPSGGYDIHWQRGQLMFELITAPQPLGQEQLTDAATLASVIDNLEQAAAPLSLGQHTVTPPATELQRLQSALLLEPFFLPDAAAPAGYMPGDKSFVHPAGDVALAADPAGALETVDTSWKRVISATQTFQNQQNHQVFLMAVASLDADAQGAASDLADDTVPPDWTSAEIDAPVQFGDATMAFRNTSADGTTEDLSIGWTHGSLVIHADMSGPPGAASMDELSAFAQQVEAHVQTVSLPTAGISGS